MKLFANVYRLSRSCSVTYLGILVDVKISGQPFSKIVSFCFSPVFSHKFSLKFFFCWELYFCPFATWKDVSIYFVSNTSQVILAFIFCRCLCYAKKKPQYFTFTVRESFTQSHLTMFRFFFINLLRNLIMCNTLFVKKWGYNN